MGTGNLLVRSPHPAEYTILSAWGLLAWITKLLCHLGLPVAPLNKRPPLIPSPRAVRLAKVFPPILLSLGSSLGWRLA